MCRPNEFRLSQQRIRLWRNSTALVGASVLLSCALVVGVMQRWSSGSLALAPLTFIFGTAVLCWAVVTTPARLSQIVVIIENGLLTYRTPMKDQLVPLASVSHLARIVDGTGRTLELRLNHSAGKTRLAGFEDLDSMYDVVSGYVQDPSVGHEVRHGRNPRWALRGAYLLSLMSLLLTLGTVICLHLQGVQATLALLCLVHFGGVIVTVISTGRPRTMRDAISLFVFLLGSAGLWLAVAMYWFWLLPMLKERGLSP